MAPMVSTSGRRRDGYWEEQQIWEGKRSVLNGIELGIKL